MMRRTEQSLMRGKPMPERPSNELNEPCDDTPDPYLAALRAALIEGEASGDPRAFDFDAFIKEKRSGRRSAD
jgi:hypothetical protein